MIKPKFYMKKPTMYEAVQVKAETIKDIVEWTGGTQTEQTPGRVGVTIPKLNPTVATAYRQRIVDGEPSGGDWVLRDSSGAFRVVDNETFTKVYMEVPKKAGA